MNTVKLKRTVTPAEKVNLFGALGGMLADGLDAEMQSDEADIFVKLADIEIQVQVRDAGSMEDEEQTLADLGRSLRKRQAQAIVIRTNRPGGEKPYLLVAGERRVRGARLEGLETLRARLMTLTDEEAEDLQAAENIHRKNLTQIEEAKKIQRDLDQLGSIEAVLEKHQKSRPWLSKMMALLNLPEQAKRLVTENVSADVEVINAVKTIEKVDPVKAKALVDDLKESRGKADARKKVNAVKEVVKPTKKQQAAKQTPEKQKSFSSNDMKQGGTAATPKDRSQEAPSAGEIFSDPKNSTPIHGGADPFAGESAEPNAAPLSASATRKALNAAYTGIFEFGSKPSAVIEGMADADRETIEAHLAAFYDAGKQAKDTGRAVVLGFRNGTFSSDGDGAFALVAFLHGADSEAKFNLLNIFGSVKD